MGFKYKKHEFREGEVIEPHRIRENMQTLAHEINGKLDRENLPLDGIITEMIDDQSFNQIVTFTETASKSLSDSTVSFQEIILQEIEVPVDGLVMAHFGCTFEWVMGDATLADSRASGSSADYADGIVTQDSYADLKEHSLDFRLRINGEDVSESTRFSFVRQRNSVFLSGCLPSAAGQVSVSADVRLFRRVSGREKQSDVFYANIKERNLVIQVKKR